MTPAALQRVSALWDALELQPVASREAWLAALPAADAVHVATLRAMQRSADGPGDGLSLGAPALSDGAGTDAGTDAGGVADIGRHTAGELVGPYRLLRSIGQGGMGEVWLARRDDGMPAREVAVKLPLLFTGPATLQRRFERERDILAGLTHPHIARLYDAGVAADGQPYMALEYVAGEPITDHCDRLRLSIDARVALFLQVVGAVQYAHSRLVIHRDLKPSNIMVTAAGEVRLLDFGIAKFLDDASTGAATDRNARTALTRLGGGPALTLDYASPEQILQQPVGTPTDVYSLGVLLYELLCGERPCRWRQTTREALEAAVLAAPRPLASSRIVASAAALRGALPRALCRQLRGDLDTIALKALKPLPGDRYSTADALGDDLRRWRSGEPVRARPDSRWYRFGRFASRNRLAVAGVALVVAGLSAGLGVALWQAQVARTEARTAQATERFLVGLFEANSLEQDDPAKAQRTTARELLDRGSRRVIDSLDDAPEAKMRLLGTLASLSRGLSLDETRYLVESQRLNLFSSLHPQPGLALARELIDTAEAAQASVTAVGEAPALLARAEAMLDTVGSDDFFARGRIELIKGNLADGDNCTALPHALRGVALLKRVPASPELIDGLLLASQAQTYCGEPSAALSAAEEAIALLQSLHQRRGLPDAYRMVAKAQMSRGKMALGFAAGRQALAAAESQHPSDDTPGSDVLNTLASLANGLVACGQPAEALQLIGPRLQRTLADTGHTDPDAVVSVLIQQALASVGIGEPQQAVQVLARAAALLPTFHVEDAQRAKYLEALAVAHLAQGDAAGAHASLAQAGVLHLALHHAGTTQINGYAATRVHADLQSGRTEMAQTDVEAFVPKPLATGQTSRSEFEQRLLRAEITAARRQWDETLRASRGILLDLQRHPEPRFVRDQRARAAALAASALQALGDTAEAAAQRRIADDIFTAMKRVSPDGT